MYDHKNEKTGTAKIISLNIPQILEKINTNKPLIHHITNYVTVNDCANVTLAIGASPVMAHAIGEVKDMTNISSALVLNIGTLDNQQIESMIIAGKAAKEKGIPIILDPCGSGATPYRTRTANMLIETLKPEIIKGNAGEIASLAGTETRMKGVDSETEADTRTAELLAEKTGATIIITGEKDIVADNNRTFIIEGGSTKATEITGAGCMAASMIASTSAVEQDKAIAAATALKIFAIAQERAEINSKGPNSFRQEMIDEIYRLKKDTSIKATIRQVR